MIQTVFGAIVMCLSIPGRIVSISGKSAVADFAGKILKINTELIKAKPGDYVLAYNGYAMEKINEKEAKHILSKMKGF